MRARVCACVCVCVCVCVLCCWFVIVMQILSVGPVIFPQFSTPNFTIVSFSQMYSRTLLLCTIQFHYDYNDRVSSFSSSSSFFFLPVFLSFSPTEVYPVFRKCLVKINCETERVRRLSLDHWSRL